MYLAWSLAFSCSGNKWLLLQNFLNNFFSKLKTLAPLYAFVMRMRWHVITENNLTSQEYVSPS